eukprot:jgi/Psemu1/32378/gm1.32378_g
MPRQNRALALEFACGIGHAVVPGIAIILRRHPDFPFTELKVLNSFFLCFKKPSPSVSSSVSLGSEFIHCLRKFSGSLGKFTLDTWKVFDYLDDILEDSGELDLTEGIYNFTPKAPVLQLEHHNATLAANTQMEYVPTPPTAANHTEWIKGQNAFFVPYDMVPQVIGKGAIGHGYRWKQVPDDTNQTCAQGRSMGLLRRGGMERDHVEVTERVLVSLEDGGPILIVDVDPVGPEANSPHVGLKKMRMREKITTKYPVKDMQNSYSALKSVTPDIAKAYFKHVGIPLCGQFPANAELAIRQQEYVLYMNVQLAGQC